MVKTMSNNLSSSSADETKKQRKKQAKREAKAMLAVEQAKQGVQKAEQKIAKFQARLEARVARLRTLEAKLSRIRTSSQESETGTSNEGVDGHQAQSESTQEPIAASIGDSQAYTTAEGNEASTGATESANPSNDQEAGGSNATDEAEATSSTNTASPTDQETDDANVEDSQAHMMNEEDENSTDAPIPAASVNIATPTEQEVSLPPAEGRDDILSDQNAASTQAATDTAPPLPEEYTGTSQQEVLSSESEGSASNFDPSHTESAQPADETREEGLGTEDNFQWWSGPNNQTTPAHDTTVSSTNSEEQETRESLDDN